MMARDKRHHDDEAVPRATWWLLNGVGEPPTWRQLERGAVVRRREVPLSRFKGGNGKGGEGDDDGTGEVSGDEDAGGRAQVAETAGSKPNKAGAGTRGNHVRGAGVIGLLMNTLRNRPAKGPPSSDVVHQDDGTLELTQGSEGKSRSDTSWHSTPEHPDHLTHDSHRDQTS